LANTRSAEKAARVTRRRAATNRRVKSALKTYVKNARNTLEKADVAPAQEATNLAIAKLDQAGARGFVHRNTVARSKSRLTRRLNALVANAASAKRGRKPKSKPKSKREPKPAPTEDAEA
jgi:small subunit ribosomal protein S20